MRLIGLVILAAILTLAPLSAEAQQSGKVPRIGFLANVRSPATEGFQQGLRELGYVEGQNIIVEWRFAEGRVECLPGLAAELVRLQVDIIVAPNPFYVEPDISNELAAERLELLKEALPRVNRVAFPTDSRVLEATPFRETEIAARALQVQLEVFTVRDARDAKEMGNAFDSMAKRGARGVIESGTPAFYAQRREIAALALKNRLPLMSAWGESPEAGGFMSYSASLPDLMRRSVAYVDKILKGAKPADLPVQQPTKFELVINLKTAKALGLTIPQSILQRADQVIE
jgi:putative tryptophan/tyrosine transport system substrate-binding protein